MNEAEFHERIPEWISKDKDTWNHITYLAYFCHKYEKVNGVKFRLVRGRKGPTMGKEAGDFAKLFKILAPEDYASLKPAEKKKVRAEINWKVYNYINWTFDYKFRMKMGSVNGTRLFHISSLIVEFERMYNVHQAKKKAAEKMTTLVSWCMENHPEILDTHQIVEPKDLQMLVAYMRSYKLSDDEPEGRVLAKAQEIGIEF